MTSESVLLFLGAACAIWTIGLATWVAVAERHHRIAALYVMTAALRSILERTGDLRRREQASDTGSAHPFASAGD